MINSCKGAKGLLILTAAAGIFAFAASAHAQRAGQSMSVQTGRVVGATPVDLQSAAAGGAVVGGILGYVGTSSRQGSSRRARNTILGAAAGGALSGRAQGDRSGMQFAIETAPGSTIQVVTDQTEIKVGDCVNVEQAGTGTANVRRVSPALCEAAATKTIDADIQADMAESADRCLQAKDRLLEAETDEQIEVAIRRVKILCDD